MDTRWLFSLIASSWLLLSTATAADTAASYQLGPGDTFRIQVYGEDDLSMDVMLHNSGKFDYPYLGELDARGQTTAQLQALLTEQLRGDYLVNPKVMVSIVTFRQIYVNGEVNKPGGYPYQPGLTIDKAVALAGGFTERAAKENIMLNPDEGNNQVTQVTPKQSISPGDIIVVKQSFF
ncbi:capsular polysaccharide biosynthesis protein [Neiella marina]|uniref:Capsular polysaccharide biosynthesis protein n=1 Tax=Neiella marina TaxID=508461 RepID=A0A8J2XMF6_9GAMM|nr:polysaccharide biosynthesis/export family protein [Neiella marina]GGA64575.1 capsular polysaccharide biosynthesis protein [Neiella marina]